jgi:hypothetical protein
MGQIGIVDTVNGEVRNLTDFSDAIDNGEIGFTDIAVGPDGDLIGITLSNVWNIDFFNGSVDKIGRYLGNLSSDYDKPVFINGLSFDSRPGEDVLYAMGANNPDLSTMSQSNGTLTSKGEVKVDGDARFSGGDLAWFNDALFAATTPDASLSETDALIKVDPDNPEDSSIVLSFSSNMYPRIFGLAGTGDQLFALQDKKVYEVMDLDNSPTLANSVSWEGSGLGDAWGATAINGAFQQISAPASGAVFALALALLALCRQYILDY